VFENSTLAKDCIVADKNNLDRQGFLPYSITRDVRFKVDRGIITSEIVSLPKCR
jgi:hypothetical protein